MRLLPSLLVLILSLGGCKPSTSVSSDPATQEKAAHAAPAPAPAPSVPAAPVARQEEAPRKITPSKPMEPIHEEAVRDLVKEWLAAQNGGEFAAYSALYADKMEGIKRSGPRTRRYGRAGWLADRERMFKKRLTVQASEVKVSVARNTATVLFTQTWASATYKDVGLKQLVLDQSSPHRGGLRIVREEMLNSKILGGTKQGAGVPLAQMGQVMGVEGSHFLVLDSAPEVVDGGGRRRLISQGDPVVMALELKPARVPEALQALQGKPLQLYGLRGKVCKARITGFVLLGRITPHFGTRQQWEIKDRDPRMQDAQVANEAWALTSGQPGGRVLAGTLGPVSGDCKGALLARPASATELEVAAAKDADQALRTLALAAFRKLPAHATLQKEFAATVKGAKGPWDTYLGATPRVVVMRHKKVNKILVAVTAQAGVGCGEFEAELWGAWQVVEQAGKQVLEPLAAPPAWQLYRPEAALDVDGDGELELLIDGGLLRLGKDGYKEWQRLQVPNLDCHC